MTRTNREPAARSHSASIDRHGAAGVLLFLALLGVLGLHVQRFYPFLSDDALITFRYAQRFVDGHGLTWNDGPPLEGYSNFLWLLLLIPLHALGLDLVDASRWLGAACAVAMLGALWHIFRPRAHPRWLPFVAAGGSLVLSGPIAAWTIGGLEQPLVAALLAWAMALSLPLFESGDIRPIDALAPSVPLALLCLTRPDGALFTASTCLALVLSGGLRRRALSVALAMAALPALAYVGHLGFRLAYYHEWVPNTARVKLYPTPQVLLRGAGYLLGGLAAMLPLSLALLAAPVVGLFRRRSRGPVLLLICHAAAWSAYVVLIGGDFFNAWRQLVPLYVLAAIAFGLLIEAGLPKLQHRERLLAALLILALLAAHLSHQLSDLSNRLAVKERWVYQAKVIAETLRRAFANEQPLVAVTAAGSIPFWSGLPALDMLGLNDAYLARHPPADFGHGDLAHGLGDGDYVLRRAPDIVVYGDGLRQPIYTSGRQLDADPRYHQRYRVLHFEGGAAPRRQWYMWLAVDSPRIGISRRRDAVTIPGYFFAGDHRPRAALDADGDLSLVIAAGETAVLPSFALSPGRWRTRIAGSGRALLAVFDPDLGVEIAESEDGGEISIAEEGRRLELRLSAAHPAGATVKRLRFQRLLAAK